MKEFDQMFCLASFCRLNHVEPHKPLDFIKVPKDTKHTKALIASRQFRAKKEIIDKNGFAFTDIVL